MRIEIIPYDITRHDEPGPFCGTPGEPVILPRELCAHDPLPRAGERIVWQGRAYTVDDVTHDHDREAIVLRARRWPAKVAP